MLQRANLIYTLCTLTGQGLLHHSDHYTAEPGAKQGHLLQSCKRVLEKEFRGFTQKHNNQKTAEMCLQYKHNIKTLILQVRLHLIQSDKSRATA